MIAAGRESGVYFRDAGKSTADALATVGSCVLPSGSFPHAPGIALLTLSQQPVNLLLHCGTA